MTDNDVEFYKEVAERERYTHSIMWRGIQFFVVLVSGLITAGVSLATVNLYASFPTFVLATFLTFLGRYVLVKESKYFHEERWKLVQFRKRLGYYAINEMGQTTEASKNDPQKSLQEYLDENVESKSGVRYAFRLIYLLQAVLCWLTYTLLFGKDFDSFRFEGQVFNTLAISIMWIIVIAWYRCELRALYDHVCSWLYKFGLKLYDRYFCRNQCTSAGV